VTTFTYDNLNRRIGANYADGTSTSFTHDGLGRLVHATDSAAGAGSITFAYDVLDRLIQETTGQGTVSYQYDVLGRRTQMATNGQQPVTYQYDAASQLARVEQGALFATLGYDNAGRRTALGYSNGTTASYAYDIAGRLLSITHSGPSGIIEALTYNYDAAGNRTSLLRSNGTASLLPSAVQAAYDAANEQTEFTGASLTYDQNGNLSSDGTNAYQWDARDRLVGISGGVMANFVYDTLGRRVSKTINGLATQFIYDGNDIVTEVNGGTVAVNYLRNLSVDEPLIRQATTGNEYYHTDALGSSLVLSNMGGTSVITYSYEPFGKTAVTGTSGNPFQYTGRENDETGLYHLRARYHSPKHHRLVSEDPTELAGGDPNLYSYAMGSPINFVDPFGLCPVCLAPALPSIGAALVAAGDAALLTAGVVASSAIISQILQSRAQGNQKDTGLGNKTDKEIQQGARDKSLSGEERRRYQKEEKARGLRNKQKRQKNPKDPKFPAIAPDQDDDEDDDDQESCIGGRKC
jgi:RHS repeat-associated protein